MKVISVANQKGGCGKTTVIFNLAINLSYEDSRVLLIDTDPQKSTWETIQCRKDNSIETAYVDSNVHKYISKLEGYDYVLIDTPPHNDETIRSSIICSDIVLIPIQDSPLDIRSAGRTVDIILEAKKVNAGLKPFFILNRVQLNTILSKELRKHLRRIYPTIAILKIEVSNRVVYKQAMIYGQAVTEYERLGAASNEMNLLTKEVINEF